MLFPCSAFSILGNSGYKNVVLLYDQPPTVGIHYVCTVAWPKGEKGKETERIATLFAEMARREL